MRTRVFGRYADVTAEETAGRSVVVIDVFRTTTVMVAALEHGAAAVFPAGSREEAVEAGRSLHPGSFLLAGERRAIPLEGFHMGNSPFEFTSKRVAGKTIIMSTSNGTRAVKAGAEGARLFIASFSNIAAVTDAVLAYDKDDLCVVCSGTLGNFALEDALCAGMILSRLERAAGVEVCDLGWVVKRAAAGDFDLTRALKEGSLAYKIMEETGYSRDVEYCLRVDTSRTVPSLGPDGLIRAE